MSRPEIAVKTFEFYDEHWTDYPPLVEGMVEHVKILFPDGVTGKRVLDAGCGSGMASQAFASQGAKVLGVDASEKCVENSRRRTKDAGLEGEFELHDLTTLDLKGRKFDVVYSWGVIHHSTDAKACFDRLVAHLEDDGTIVIAVYLKTGLSGFWNESRAFYQHSPAFIKALIRAVLSGMLNCVDAIRKVFGGEGVPFRRGTSNQEQLNDWFGVPQRSFHSYEEVFGWFREHNLEYTLSNPATGRFKSTSNFEVIGRKAPRDGRE